MRDDYFRMRKDIMGKDLKGKEIGKGITQRKDGKFMGRVMYHGKSIALYDDDLKQLKVRLQEARRNMLVEAAEAIPRRELLLSEWFDEWYNAYKKPTLKETAVYSYTSRFNNYYGVRIGQKTLKDIRPIHIQNVIAELVDLGRSPKSIREATGILQKCLDAAVANGHIQTNPALGVVIPKMGKVERRVLSQEEQEIFLNYIHDNHSWYEEMYLIMFLTGMRIGEIGGLQWNDIDFNGKFIHVNRALAYEYKDGEKKLFLTSPKTENSYRAIPFFGETKQVLLAQQEKISRRRKELGKRWRTGDEFGNLVFYTSLGSPVGKYIAERDMRQAVAQINLISETEAKYSGKTPVVMERIYPHAIRHTFATRCFERGMTPRMVQEIMGHSNYNVTVSYTHVLEDIKLLEAKKIGNFLTPGKSKSEDEDTQNMYNIVAGLI